MKERRNSMQSITVQIEVPMGHRLQRHEGKCKHLHGHNYLFVITVEGTVDDKTGFIVDFSQLKAELRDYFLQYDHAMLLEATDPMVRLLDEKTKLCVLQFPPTAENIARMVKEHISLRLGFRNTVTVWETRDCSASA